MTSYSLALGAAKVEITPQSPMQLAGFASRGGALYEKVDSPLYARIYYLRQEQESEEEPIREILLVIVDLLNWEYHQSERVRVQIEREYGIPRHAVILHATHNHSGPAVMDGIDVGVPEPAYLEWLQKAVCSGVQEAIAACEPVTVARGIGSFDLAWNRRHEEAKDDELNVIRFLTRQGTPKALWVNYSCHPVISSEPIVTSEYCGYAADRLERQLGHGAIVGFLQGACADIDPRVPSGKRGIEGVREAGELLLRAVTSVLDGNMAQVDTGEVKLKRDTAELPYERVPSAAELREALDSESPLERKWAAFMLRNPDRLKASATLEIAVLQLSNQLSLLFMNGEMVTRFGLFAKMLSGGTVIPVAYSHAFIGYVTTAAQLQAGGYEPHGSVYYLGLPSSYDSSVESIVLDRIQQGITRS